MFQFVFVPDKDRMAPVETRHPEDVFKLKRGNSSLDSKEEIDQRVFLITKAIQKVIQETIPTAKPSKFAKPYWTSQCTDVVRETRKARRIWKTYGTEENWIKYQKASNKKKAQIKRDKTIGWRAAVSEASRDPTKIWKLAKWARKDLDEKHMLPQMPDIKDAEGLIHTEASDKARVMAGHFSPNLWQLTPQILQEPSTPKN
ncbi:hypothetical protein K3495_g5077 [Podosphaera aphanis]|nr:hypothetical protein K3495_g5077 [Podosphaera aphanis]